MLHSITVHMAAEATRLAPLTLASSCTGHAHEQLACGPSGPESLNAQQHTASPQSELHTLPACVYPYVYIYVSVHRCVTSEM